MAVADFSTDLHVEGIDPELRARLAGVVDADGKIPRALETLGPLSGRDVVLLEAGGLRARQIAELGANLIAMNGAVPSASLADALRGLRPAPRVAHGRPDAIGLPDDSVDAVVACWSAFRGPSPAEVAEADRVLRPGGRLLVLHDYGRDDVSQLWPEAQAQQLAWSRRDGWFLRSGFKIRVIHCWWTFETIDEAADLLGRLHGEAGTKLAAAMKRPRLSYNVAIYHRSRGDRPDGGDYPGTAAAN